MVNVSFAIDLATSRSPMVPFSWVLALSATTGLFAKPGIPVEVAEIVGQNLSAVEGQVLRAVNKAAKAAADAEIAFNASPTSP